MGKQEYIQANKEWLAAKAKEEGVMALPKGIYYKVLASGANDGKHPTPRSIVTAHYTRTYHQRKEIRQQPRRNTHRLPPERPDRGMDYRHATHVCGRQMGGVHPGRNGLREILATGHSGRVYPDFRNRAAGHRITYRACAHTRKLP